ncbi:unnamed protein product [Paramecium sonneborni]|uniref:Transmembrane protein n=1 Tax=Paramecium sonneborni TaxID=65129 RepID=A0A8S1R0Z3_9CILI|nr:unnamed protein product [Paramecium sonneborni]
MKKFIKEKLLNSHQVKIVQRKSNFLLFKKSLKLFKLMILFQLQIQDVSDLIDLKQISLLVILKFIIYIFSFFLNSFSSLTKIFEKYFIKFYTNLFQIKLLLHNFQ